MAFPFFSFKSEEYYPGPGRVFRNIKVENFRSVVFDDKETIQNQVSWQSRAFIPNTVSLGFQPR